MRGLIISGLLLTMAAAPALAGDTPPNWRHRPTDDELLAVWPKAALAKGVQGRAQITCKVSLQGALYDCAVDSEAPAGLGFGAAALALSPQFLMTPKLHDGVPEAGGEVSIPITFETPSAPSGNVEAGARIVSRVPWIEAPTYDQVVAAYPKQAQEAKVGGHTTLDCRFTGQGRMTDCSVIVETPKGMGFGHAAKTLAADFLAPRADGAGASLKGASTQIAFTFDPAMLADSKPVIGKPEWARLPEAADVAAGYPPAAKAANISAGKVRLGCDVGPAGRLTACVVTLQDPAGLGFDKAALALSSDFQVSVWTPEGLPTVGGHITVPLLYQLKDGPGPATSPPKP